MWRVQTFLQDKSSDLTLIRQPPMYNSQFWHSKYLNEPSAFAYVKKKDADQLRSNYSADKCLCFCYTDSTIPLLSKSEISSL